MTPILRNAAWAALVMIFVAAGVRAQVVRIPDRVEVDREHLSLGDLAQDVGAELGDLSFGYAPYPGHVRWLSRAEVVSALHRAGQDGLRVEMADKILVTRASQRLSKEAVRDAVAAYLASSHPQFRFELLELEVPQDIALPAGRLELRVESANTLTRLDGVTLKLAITIDGKVDRSQWVRVRARARGSVVVASRPVSYGEALNRSNLDLVEKDLTELDGLLTDIDQVAGAIAKRGLQTGDILSSRDFQEPVLIKRGDLVTVVARVHNLTVSASARARDSGGRGDLIVVQNLDSKQLVEARVIGANRVEVVLAGSRR